MEPLIRCNLSSEVSLIGSFLITTSTTTTLLLIHLFYLSHKFLQTYRYRKVSVCVYNYKGHTEAWPIGRQTRRKGSQIIGWICLVHIYYLFSFILFMQILEFTNIANPNKHLMPPLLWCTLKFNPLLIWPWFYFVHQNLMLFSSPFSCNIWHYWLGFFFLADNYKHIWQRQNYNYSCIVKMIVSLFFIGCPSYHFLFSFHSFFKISIIKWSYFNTLSVPF